ncbi:alpha/beta fold hydrolase [Acetobacter sp. LMG 32666]|uniref:alpha/beta fold hydrolase n=1 Tax=Acetobacter sp. LMG 32666 TaxID=2959295 RepID=UPI0030C8D1B6
MTKQDVQTQSFQLRLGAQAVHVRQMGGGAGLPLLLVHGFGGSVTNWQLTQQVQATNRRVIAFDLPGHGQSSALAQAPTLEHLAQVTRLVLEGLGVSKAHILGHSLGGGIALSLLQSAPAQVASLSLLAPAGLGRAVNMAFITSFVEASTVADMAAAMAMAVYDPKLIGRKVAEFLVAARAMPGARAALRAIAQTCFPNGQQANDLRPVLQNSPGPIQILWGEQDRVLPAPQVLGLSAHVTHHSLPRTGHLPHIEQASTVNAMVRDFLCACEKPA